MKIISLFREYSIYSQTPFLLYLSLFLLCEPSEGEQLIKKISNLKKVRNNSSGCMGNIFFYAINNTELIIRSFKYMTCKHCNTEILYKTFGLKDFCSTGCRKEYRRIYQAKAKRKSRQIEKTMSTSYPLDVNKSNPYVSIVREGGESMSETLYEDFGGKSWYSLAKRDCCNFEVREQEGYCVTLAEPYTNLDGNAAIVPSARF
jgi:hypothetical protein